MMLYNMHYGWGMGIGWSWIVGLVILVVVLWIMFRMLNTNNRTDQTGQKSALDILKERYARGEISKEEYDEKRRDIVS